MFPFIDFTNIDGDPITVNIPQITTIQPSHMHEGGTRIAFVSGVQHVKESPDVVRRAIRLRMTTTPGIY